MNKITYSDVIEYNYLFTLAPAFVLKGMAKRNSNLVSKFKSTIQSYLVNLTDEQKSKLDIILNSDVGYLQDIMRDAYSKTNKKQYKILADPDNIEFIELNLNEIKKLKKD